jgi:hypothetical protein
MNQKRSRSKTIFLTAMCFAGVFFFAGRDVQAGGGPENVLVVVNEQSDSSLLIANHYVSLRKIPDRNVLYLKDIPFKEVIEFDFFIEKILRPILATIEDRKLAGSIDYIVYSADFPTTVRVRKQQQEFFEAAKILKEVKKVYNAEASINSLTFLAARSIHQPIAIFDLESNHYYRVRTNQMLRQPFRGSLQKEFERSVKAFSKPADDPLFESAIDSLEQMIKNNPGQTAVLYWLTKFAAKKGDDAAATRWMTKAIRMGWSDRTSTITDLDFTSVEDSVFKGLVKRMGNEGRTFTASRSFRQLYQWAPNGMLNQTAGQGERYFLSTVLAVTRNDGNSEAEALLQLKRSVNADYSKPRGVFYFADNKDVRAKTRRNQFPLAVDALREMGARGEIIKTKMPMKKEAVLGLTSGISKFNFAESESTIIPGAICENLTSFGGRVGAIGGQTKFSEFLRFGAAGSMGTVVEPYTVPNKFPHAMIHVHYARGCSLAEAFYQSIQGPFQTLIVGDALCQPFATPPRVLLEGVEPMEEVSGIRELRFDASDSPVRVAGVELFIDGTLRKRDGRLDPIDNFDTSLLSDGYHEIRAVFVAANRIQTTSRAILPIVVNNEGKSCSLECDTPYCLIDDMVSVSATAAGATSIRICQHERTLAEISGDSGSVTLLAKTLGRGPTSIRAIAMIDGKEVSSVPVAIRVNGPISSTRVRTAKKKKKPASKKPPVDEATAPKT